MLRPTVGNMEVLGVFRVFAVYLHPRRRRSVFSYTIIAADDSFKARTLMV